MNFWHLYYIIMSVWESSPFEQALDALTVLRSFIQEVSPSELTIISNKMMEIDEEIRELLNKSGKAKKLKVKRVKIDSKAVRARLVEGVQPVERARSVEYAIARAEFVLSRKTTKPSAKVIPTRPLPKVVMEEKEVAAKPTAKVMPMQPLRKVEMEEKKTTAKVMPMQPLRKVEMEEKEVAAKPLVANVASMGELVHSLVEKEAVAEPLSKATANPSRLLLPTDYYIRMMKEKKTTAKVMPMQPLRKVEMEEKKTTAKVMPMQPLRKVEMEEKEDIGLTMHVNDYKVPLIKTGIRGSGRVNVCITNPRTGEILGVTLKNGTVALPSPPRGLDASMSVLDRAWEHCRKYVGVGLMAECFAWKVLVSVMDKTVWVMASYVGESGVELMEGSSWFHPSKYTWSNALMREAEREI
jgi:hypothetical protein